MLPSASVTETSGARRKIPLLAVGRNHRLLQDEFQEVGKGLEQAPGTDDVRTTAQLHGCPDLAVGIEARKAMKTSSATKRSTD
jgi:hypothetical protein